jgi:hypothetical protein
MAREMGGFPYIEDSESRKIDMKIFAEELPYGYMKSPPPADTGDYDMYSLQTKKEYPRKKRS